MAVRAPRRGSSYVIHRICRIALCAAVCHVMAGHLIRVVNAADRTDCDREFAAALEQLAIKCDTLKLPDQATTSRNWHFERDPQRYYFFVPPASDATAPQRDAPQLVKYWHEKFREIRRRHAASLFDLARHKATAGAGATAYQQIHEVLRDDPDHEAARRILGYRKLGSRWAATFGTPRSRRVRGRHPFLTNSSPSYWRIDSDHFQIETDASTRVAIEVAEYLERIHFVWRQLFFDYWSDSKSLAAALARGSLSATGRRKYRVVLFQDRDQYVNSLQRFEPRIGITAGYYSQQRQLAFFFVGDLSVRRNWAHETTHQLFQETRSSSGAVGASANFWAVEGAALYMESLVDQSDFLTTGGVDALRLQYARYRALSQPACRPLAELVTLGRTALQADPDIHALYSQSAGLTQFFLHTHMGRMRSPFVKYLKTIYEPSDDARTLAQLVRSDYPQLDRQYIDFLNVTDNDMSFVSPNCTRLCLTHTQITDAGLQQLPSLPQLEWLDLAFTRSGDVGLAHFQDCRKLNQLSLEKTQITDQSMAVVAQFAELEELDLSNTAVSDQGLIALCNLTRLKVLWLTGTRVSDQSLPALAKLHNLEQLEVDQTEITPDGLKTLRQNLRKLKE